MGQLAVGIAGGIAGVAIGIASGGVGFAALATYAAVGLSVGTMVGGILFPAQVRQEGSRIGDLSVQSSAYGAVRPIGYGRLRLAGNVIWSLPIQEIKTEARSGKGGPSVTSITYTYSATFALALCEGPVDKVLRIWADSKLVYDASAGTDAVNRPGFKFRFYPGSETQLPDSIIEADKGVGNVPGYRGTCYLVFDAIPLADYGNRIPNMSCEIAFQTEAAHDYLALTRASPSIFGSLDPLAIGTDWERGVGYLQGKTPNGILVYDLATMQTQREVPMSDILSDGTDGGLDPDQLGGTNTNLFVGPDGALYFAVSLGGYTTSRLVRIDPNTMRETATFPDHSIIFNSTTTFASSQYLGSISLYDTTGALLHYLVVLGFFGDLGVLELPDMIYGAGSGMEVTGTGRAVVAGKVTIGVGDAWVLSMTSLLAGSNTHLYISRLRIGEAGALDNPVGATLTEMVVFSATDFDATMASFTTTPGSLSYDESDDSLLLKFNLMTAGFVDGGTYLVKWSPASGIVFAALIATGSDQWNALASRISGGTFAQLSASHLYMIDSASGATMLAETTPPAGGADWTIGNYTSSAQVYDSTAQAIYSFVNDGGGMFFAKLRLGRSTALTTTLGDIVADQCLRAGFVEADFDVSALTDVVEGFVVSQRASVVDVLTPLLGVYLVDAVETDYVLYFKHRGGTALVSIAEDDLIRTSDAASEPYTETRQQEIELPMRLTLTYLDSGSDYQTNTQIAKRVRNPDPTVFSDNQADVNIAIVSTTTPMKQRAETMLYAAWNERHQFAVRLPPQYGYLDTADPVTVVFNDGYTARARLGAIGFGADYVTDTKLIAETDGQYVSTATAAAATPWAPSHAMPDTAPVKSLLLDIPLLRDIDDMGGRVIRAYWAASSYASTATWPGAVLQQSGDASDWTTLTGSNEAATWGFVSVPPADTTAVFATQYDGTMTVSILGGDYEPSSITDLAMANGENPILLIKANGEVEIVQYRDAVSLGAGLWELSVLRRGQRGTDTMATGHAAGETFVFLSVATIDSINLPSSQQNVSEFYRAVMNGGMASSAATSSFTFHARDQMPYAPVDFTRALVGDDLYCTWKRRTRIGGWLQDGSDTVALQEATEHYEAYRIANAGMLTSFSPSSPGTYIRSWLGLTSPHLAYTAATMTADAFDPAAETLHLAVYQVSATAGRGFRGYQALPYDAPVPDDTPAVIPPPTPASPPMGLARITAPLVGAVAAGTWVAGDLVGGPVLPGGGQMHYEYLLPDSYDDTKTYPVLVWLHQNDMGNPYYSGDAGANWLSSEGGPDGWWNNEAFRRANPCIVLLPYCNQLTDPSGATVNFGGWDSSDDGSNESAVVTCVNTILALFTGDPSRVYAMGASLGGNGTWALMMDHNAVNGTISQLFAAGVPMAGSPARYGFDFTPPDALLTQLESVPIFAVHGTADTTSPPTWDRDFWSGYAGNTIYPAAPGGQAGVSHFRYLEDTSLGHDVWDTYAPPSGAGAPIYEWLFAQISGLSTVAPAIPGAFTISGGAILADGVPWIGKGMNVYDFQLADIVTNAACEPLLTLFPGTTFLRVANFSYIAPDDAVYAQFVAWTTGMGIVVMLEDHFGISADPLTGGALVTETDWYAAHATYHKTNPRVWFGSPNEPGTGLGVAATTTQQLAVYDAIRATGSDALFSIQPPGGGNPGLVGNGGGQTMASYLTMTRAFVELHFYGWTTLPSTDQAVVSAGLEGSAVSNTGVAACRTYITADGVPPVILGEFGPSSDGTTLDANGDQVIAAAGASGLPWTAWHWWSTAAEDNLTDGSGNITSFGLQVQALIAAP